MNAPKTLLFFLLLMIEFSGSLSAQSTGKIFYKDESPKVLFNKGVGNYLEGPTVSEDGEIFFCDIGTPDSIGTVIWRYAPNNGKASVFRSPSNYAAGLMFDRNGKLIVCEFKGQKVIRVDVETGFSEILANSFQGNPFNGPNDVAIDEKGNLYFTDSKVLGTDPMPQGVHGVYRIGYDGKLDLMIGGYGKPNGIILSPDQKILYIATWDNVRTPRNFKGAKPRNGGKLIAFNLLENGGITFKQELADLGRPADGMTIDMDGNIYVTRGFGKKITVFSPSGEIIDELSLPDDWITTNATFGRGDNKSTLYITAGKTLYSIRTKALGYNLPFEE